MFILAILAHDGPRSLRILRIMGQRSAFNVQGEDLGSGRRHLRLELLPESADLQLVELFPSCLRLQPSTVEGTCLTLI